MSDADVRAALAPVDLQVLVNAVAAVVPFHAGLRTRIEAYQVAARKAMGWRLARIKPMVAEAERSAVIAWMAQADVPPVVVPPGEVRVLTGGLGAGKTEQAIRWWEGGLQAVLATESAEIGAIFTPRAIVSLESAVIAELGHEPVHPCRIVIDDLDSVSRQNATRLLMEARALVHAWPKVSVLATARHEAVVLADEERLVCAPWPIERGSSLLGAIVGEDFYWPHWTSETRDVLTSPLTTLGLARRLKAGHHTTISRSELLSELASMAVEQQRGDVSEETWQDLSRLSVAILDRAASVSATSFASPPRVRAMVETDLVVRDGDALRFALPVFEQYFGSEAIRAGLVELTTAATGTAFPLWRYALALAVANAEPSRQERLLLELARLNPATVFWIVDEIGREQRPESFEGPDAFVIETLIALRDSTGISAEPILPIRAGLWLREAEEALMDGLTPVGRRLRRRSGGLTQWGTWLQRGWMTVARARERAEPAVVELDKPHPSISLADGWEGWNQFQFPRGDFGRWYHARSHFQQRLDELIKRRTLDTPLDGMLARERAHHLARFVTDFAAPRPGRPIVLDELRTKLATWVARANTTQWSRWGSAVDSADVWWLDTYLANCTDDILERPWPAGDQPNAGEWAWESYSKELTVTLVADILREAIIGYRQLVETNFPRFGNGLGLYGMLPFHIEGFIDRPEPGSYMPELPPPDRTP